MSVKKNITLICEYVFPMSNSKYSTPILLSYLLVIEFLFIYFKIKADVWLIEWDESKMRVEYKALIVCDI